MSSPTHPSSETRSSLFSRLRANQDGAWRDFEDRYREMMLRFCRRRGLQHFDAEDVVQRVMADLLKSLPQFVYDRQRGRFRDYLYRCVRNALSNWAQQAARRPEQLRSGMVHALQEDSRNGRPGRDDEVAWEEEWVAHHYRVAMDTIRKTFEPRSVEIFDRSVAGATIPELAAVFTMTEEAVRKVRERIRDRMEELIAEQVREEDEFDG